MATEHHEISSLQALLTLASWHLDASRYAASDALRRHHERARHVHESIRRVIRHSQLSPALRSRIDELAVPARSGEEQSQAT